MISVQQFKEIEQRLGRVTTMAMEIKDLPNVADMVVVNLMNGHGAEIRQHSKWISDALGTGDVLVNTNIPPGKKTINSATVGIIQSDLALVTKLAREMEQVAYYADAGVMQQADRNCQEIALRCAHVWALLNPSSTGHSR
jgi:hypothetical protein